jgi:hypothetical protein
LCDIGLGAISNTIKMDSTLRTQLICLDSWTKHFCSIVVNDQQNAPRSQWILVMYSKFTSTCFGKWLPSSGVVGALEGTQALFVLWAYTDYDPSNVASGHGGILMCGSRKRAAADLPDNWDPPILIIPSYCVFLCTAFVEWPLEWSTLCCL